MKKLLIFLSTLAVITLGVVFSLKPSQHLQAPLPAEVPVKSQEFIVFGDTGSGLPGQVAVAQAIAQRCASGAGCTAGFLVGDVIYERGVSSVSDPQFETKFEAVYKDLTLPIYIALGNHDYAGCTACYLEYAKKSAKWKMPARYYSERFEQAEFFVIDTEKFDTAQQAWLETALKESSAPWKIVTGHRPIVSYEVTKLGENWNGRKELQDIICQEADLYVAGHAHVLEDNGPLEGCTARQLVSGGGGASLRTVKKPYPGEFFAESYGFLSLTVTKEQLQIDFVDVDGKVLHSLQKKYAN